MKKFRDAAHAASVRTIIVLLLLCLSGILFASIFRAAPNKSQQEAQLIRTPTLTPSTLLAPAITLTVTTTNDSGPGSLRQAIADAADGDTIQFDPSLNGQTITLTSAELFIAKSITISGPGPTLLRVSANHQAANFRIIHLMPNYTVAISGLTINGGYQVDDSGGGISNYANLTITNCTVSGNVTSARFGVFAGGGAIYNGWILSLVNSTVSGNSVVGGWSSGGGGIQNVGTVTIIQSSITTNTADVSGGGIANSGLLTISNGMVSSNRANGIGHFNGNGGGIINSGTLIIQNSTISGNCACGDGTGSQGGGLANSGSLGVTNSTISGNTAIQGGGIYGGGQVTNSTISGNTGYYGGGGIYGTSTVSNSTISSNTTTYNGAAIYGGGNITNSTISSNNAPSQNGAGIYASSSVELTNTILRAGTGANIINNSTVISHGYNISSDNGGGFLTGPGDQVNTDPILGLLQNNGGPTSTNALLPGSPAIDTGDPNFTPPPSTDQRGYPRVANARIDKGSFEVQGAPTPTPTPSPTPCMVLYDQTDTAGSGGVVSQNFETANNGYDAQAADDFVVPVMQNWMVQQVKVNGIYFNGPGPAGSVNVTFYFDSANFPGAVVSGGAFNNLSMSDTAGSFTIPLPTSLVLTAGTYWVSVQANIDFNPFGEWAWSDRMVASNSPAVWQNPGGGFATSCTSYGRRGANCGIDPAAPDQIFRILGCTVATAPVTISGAVSYCSNPSPGPVPNVIFTLSGSASGMRSSDASGNYLFSVPSGGSYTVTPTKPARAPGSPNINTVDVIAVQRHFLNLGTPLSGCRLTAADVNGDSSVNTVDVVAIQRFFLGVSTGIANTGRYQFTPVNRTYTGLVTNQTGQNYDALVFGDVAVPFVEP